MPFCRSCGSQMKDLDRACGSCGATVDSSAPAAAPAPTTEAAAGRPAVSGAWMGGQVASLVGSIMLVIGPFTAWVTLGPISASGMQKTGNEAIILVALGIIGVILALTSLVAKRSILSLAPVIVGLVGAGLSAYYYYLLWKDISGFESGLLTVHIGAGIYVCLVGSVLIIIGAFVSGLKLRKN